MSAHPGADDLPPTPFTPSAPAYESDTEKEIGKIVEKSVRKGNVINGSNSDSSANSAMFKSETENVANGTTENTEGMTDAQDGPWNRPKPLSLQGVRIGVNLVRASRRLLSILMTVNSNSFLYKGPIVEKALNRYENFWLPLIATYEGTTILPPIDVHWIWLVHMLAPQNYFNDCKTSVGLTIDHRLLSTKAMQRAREVGRIKWEATYSDEPWDVLDDLRSLDEDRKHTSVFTYDLRSAVERQSAFYYQVSLPHHRLKSFLCKSERRYRQFLMLKKNFPDKFLVPCYDIDVMWHAHQVHPVIYKRDTETLLGSLLPHDDSVNDRTPGSKLVTADSDTRDIWQPSFGSPFRREGAMFRSEPPDQHLLPVPDVTTTAAHASVFHVHIIKLLIRGKAPDGSLRVKFKMEQHKLGEVSLFHDQQVGFSEHNIAEFDIKFSLSDYMVTNWLAIRMNPKRRLSKILGLFGTGNFLSMVYLDDLSSVGAQGTVIKMFEDGNTCVEITMSVKREKVSSWVPLGVLTGPFIPTVLNPGILTRLYGLVVSHDIDHDSFLAEMATHRLINENIPQKPEILEVEVTHSRHLMFSSIHLYTPEPGGVAGGRVLVGVAHSLDANTLPSPLTLKCPQTEISSEQMVVCDHNNGERAMIIKTAKGDWAILVGKWEGLRRGIAGSVAKRGVPGSPGHLLVRVHCPPSAPATIIKLPYDEQIYAFSVLDLAINMQTGILKVDGKTSEWIENVTLGLAITVLQVLCQPRLLPPEGIDTTDLGGIEKGSGGAVLPRRIPVEKLVLLGALGFFCAVVPVMHRRPSVDSLGTAGTGVGLGAMGYYAGACGGCGGCGGGTTWSHSGNWTKDGSGAGEYGSGGAGDDGGDGGGHGGSDFPWGATGGDGGYGSGGDVFSYLGADGGGGDGGGDGGGGGCGGCGGCGG